MKILCGVCAVVLFQAASWGQTLVINAGTDLSIGNSTWDPWGAFQVQVGAQYAGDGSGSGYDIINTDFGDSGADGFVVEQFDQNGLVIAYNVTPWTGASSYTLSLANPDVNWATATETIYDQVGGGVQYSESLSGETMTVNDDGSSSGVGSFAPSTVPEPSASVFFSAGAAMVSYLRISRRLRPAGGHHSPVR